MFRSVLIVLAALLAASNASAAESDSPFGIFVRAEPLERIDPDSPDFLPGFRIETEHGTIRSIPSTNAVQLRSPDGTTTNIARGLLCDGIPLRRPTGLAMAGSVLLIADTANRRIVRVPIGDAGPDLSEVESWTHPEFRRPIGLAFEDGELFISDAWSDRIFVLDQNGQLLREIGQHGSQQGFLSGPIGILLHQGLLYIADSRNSRVQAFDAESGRFDSEWGLHVIRPHEAEGHLHYPTGVSLTDRGEMMVDEPWEDRRQVFRRAQQDQTIPQRLPLAADDFIHYGRGIARHDRLLAVTDPDTHTVRIFDLSLDTPVLIGVVGGYGIAPDQFIHPAAVSFLEPTESLPIRLAVCDRGNQRIALFTIDWSPDETLRFRPKLASLARTIDLRRLHEAGRETAALRFPIDPVSVCEAEDGLLAVLDDANATVVWLDARLRVNHSIAMPESPRDDGGSMWISIRNSRNGKLLCVDSVGRQLVLIPADPAESETVDPRIIDLSPWTESPTDVLRSENGFIVVDRQAHRLLELMPDGQPTRTVGGIGLGAGQFFSPVSVLPLDGGRIAVVDRGNHRLQIFDSDWSLHIVAGPRLYIAEAVIGEKPELKPFERE